MNDAIHLSTLLALASVAGCALPAGEEVDRGPIGKTDALGTCEAACDGLAAAGDCYCDDLCTFYGDCCSDYVAECVPVATRVCEGPLFDAHPIEGAIALEGFGVKVPLPFTTCGAEMTYLYGLADLAPVAALLDGTGHAPVAFPGGKTLVRLFWANNVNSDVGAFREVGLVFATVESPVPLPESPLVNDYSLVAAVLTPGVVQFMGPLVLDGHGAELATELGRRAWGLDKEIGRVRSWTADPSRQHYLMIDERSRLAARLVTHEDPSPAAQLAALDELAAAFGLPGAEALPAPAPETTFAVVNQRQDAAGVMMEWSATYGPLAGIFHRFDPSRDSLLLGTQSELGAWLESVHFDPRLTVHYPSLDVVYAGR